MIDERKMKRELQELVEHSQEDTLENRLYSLFLEYVNRQQVISVAAVRFMQRIGMYLVAAGVEIEFF